MRLLMSVGLKMPIELDTLTAAKLRGVPLDFRSNELSEWTGDAGGGCSIGDTNGEIE